MPLEEGVRAGVGGRRGLMSKIPESLTPPPFHGCSMVIMRHMWERLDLQRHQAFRDV